jgi:drug/metabolite transporter (DMT)-like permease
MPVQTPTHVAATPPLPPPPSVSPPSVAPQPPQVAQANRRGVWMALGAAAATFVGALLPWVTGPFGISASGTSGDGIIAIVLSVPLALFAWLMLGRRWATVATIVVSTLVVAMMVFEVVDISSAPLDTLGIGVIVCLGGGLAGLVGGIVGRRDLSEMSSILGIDQHP